MSSTQVRYMDSSGMEPYTEYKDSGIEWIGKVPEHWDVTKLKFLLISNDGGVWGFDEEEKQGTIVLRSTEISLDGSWSLQNPARRKLTQNEIKKFALKKGDLVITKSSGSESHIGKTALVDGDIENLKCCYSNFMQRIRPTQNQNSKYLHYIMNSYVVREQYNYLSSTTTGLSNLSAGLINQIVVPLNSNIEQQAIATFLDRETSRIDALVEKKQQFIELLEERRSALISHAVTKGLDPDVPMKDSGIEWIGEIPEHWDVVKLKYISYMKGRIGWQNLRQDEYTEEGPFLITGMHFDDGAIDWDSCYHITEERYQMAPEIQVKEHDLLITKDGSIGKLAYIESMPGKASLNSHLLLMRPLKRFFTNRFMYYLLMSDTFNLYSLMKQTGTTFNGITQNNMENFDTAFPPLQEQQAITDYLYKETSQIDTLIEKTEQSIEYLKEYRTALISSAVTGKIDVRGAVSD